MKQADHSNVLLNEEFGDILDQSDTKSTVTLESGRQSTETESLKSTEDLEERFCDRHLFSILCYRNFAHMKAIPFIQTIQRCSILRWFWDLEITPN